MRTYQLYVVKQFADLAPVTCITNKVQMTFFGEKEDIQTTITRGQSDGNGSMLLFRVTSEIKHRTQGFIRKAIDGAASPIRFYRIPRTH